LFLLFRREHIFEHMYVYEWHDGLFSRVDDCCEGLVPRAAANLTNSRLALHDIE
jgi:transposase